MVQVHVGPPTNPLRIVGFCSLRGERDHLTAPLRQRCVNRRNSPDVVETLRSGLIHAIKKMPIRVECRLDRSVSEPLLDNLRVFSLCYQKRRVSVAKAMERARLPHRLPNGRQPRPVSEVDMTHRTALGCREDEPRVVTVGSEMLGQLFNKKGGQRHCASSGIRFGPLEDKLSMNLREALLNPQRLSQCVEPIDVKSGELAKPEPRKGCGQATSAARHR